MILQEFQIVEGFCTHKIVSGLLKWFQIFQSNIEITFYLTWLDKQDQERPLIASFVSNHNEDCFMIYIEA